MKLIALILAALLLRSSADADQHTVPGDYPDLQTAVLAAEPGDTIVVETAEKQEGVVLTKPVTIVGNPIADIEEDCFGSPAALFLDGPSAGVVKLINVRTFPKGDCFSPPPSIAGGGFDELHLLHSTVVPPFSGLTGVGEGAPGIRVDVPFLSISDSTVTGGTTDSDSCFAGILLGDSHPAIDAPTSDVMVLDSVVAGGDGGYLCCQSCYCPSSLEGLGGAGGDGIVAARVFVSASQISGGEGAAYTAWEENPFGSPPLECGVQPDGQPIVAGAVIDLGEGPTSSGPLQLGSSWQLFYNSLGANATLFASAELLTTPLFLQGLGWAFMQPANATSLGSLATSGSGAFTLNVPSLPGLVGLSATFQILDAANGLSRPIVEPVVP